MVTALITIAAIAWITQLAFGGWQIRQFNRAFDRLCQQGRVGVGRSSMDDTAAKMEALGASFEAVGCDLGDLPGQVLRAREFFGAAVRAYLVCLHDSHATQAATTCESTGKCVILRPLSTLFANLV